MACLVGSVDSLILRRLASCFTSFITGSAPVPVPITNRRHFHGISYGPKTRTLALAVDCGVERRQRTMRRVALTPRHPTRQRSLVEPWACRVYVRAPPSLRGNCQVSRRGTVVIAEHAAQPLA